MTNTQIILFNVFGGNNTVFDIKANFLASAATIYGSLFLWNFVDDTLLNLASQFGGSILALNADVTNSNNIVGTLVAQSLTKMARFTLNHPILFRQQKCLFLRNCLCF